MLDEFVWFHVAAAFFVNDSVFLLQTTSWDPEQLYKV